jgi:hypothetical protein
MAKMLKGTLRSEKKKRQAKGSGQAGQAGGNDAQRERAAACAPEAAGSGQEATAQRAEAGAAGEAAQVKDQGPQPGRARKHGFYSRHFTAEELSLIAEFLLDPTLDDELWMQRVVNRRLLAYLDGGQEIGVEMMVRVAGMLATGTGRVARLLRDRQALSGDAARAIVDAVTAALADMTAELGKNLLGDGAAGGAPPGQDPAPPAAATRTAR